MLASFFLILPWLGYQYTLEMEHFLRQGQQQALISSTRAVATALHERPKLFNQQASFLPNVEHGRDLYAYDLKNKISIDGKLNDWQSESHKNLFYAQKQTVYQKNPTTNNPISFRHMLGRQGDYLYAYLQVTDKYPTFRSKNSRFLDKSDHLIIAFSTPQNELQRYIVSPQNSGWFNAYQLNDNNSNLTQSIPSKREKRLQGYWQQTKTGYNIEFRLPVKMLGDKLGFALHTTSDSKQGNLETIVATSNTNQLTQLGTILVPSPEIKKILKGLEHSQSRLWVVDRHQRVLASTGDIHQADGLWVNDQKTINSSTWLDTVQAKILTPLYSLFYNKPSSDFIDELRGSTQLNSDFIKLALTGKSQSDWRLTSDKKAIILSAASPIFIGDKVMGMVVAEETTNGIRTLRNQVLNKLFNILLAVIVVGTLLLFLFTANIATRIRRLRDQAENIIDQNGRISTTLTPSTSSDEIGDLSRSLAEMVSRLDEYHRYLEKLPARLSHELGTPVAVVRSSLENLALLPQDETSEKYIQRSQTGIKRLNRILTNMSEATRLEQSLQSGEKIILPLYELLSSCIQGYQMTYTEHHFLLNTEQSHSNKLNINADPDFMVQCLDKLVNNAMEFSDKKQPITLILSSDKQNAIIEIENSGPLLPQYMSDELLNSMVSIRTHHNTDKTHLGLGLFIAKIICDFHHGSISIDNSQNSRGVNVTLRFPLS